MTEILSREVDCYSRRMEETPRTKEVVKRFDLSESRTNCSAFFQLHVGEDPGPSPEQVDLKISITEEEFFKLKASKKYRLVIEEIDAS